MEIKNYFAQDAQGNIMPGANCYLYLPGTTTLATGLVDGNGVPISNPFLASSIGQVTFGAPNGVYDLRISQGARDTTIEIQCADLLQALNETASFLGAKSSAPTTRNDGSALQIADRYFNTSDQLEYLYKSTGWVVNNLDGQLIATSQGASLVGALMQDGSAGTVQQAITDGDARLRQDLAATTGAGMVGWTRSVQPAGSPFVYGLKGALDSSRISIQEKQWADLAIKPAATINDPRTWDWAPAWTGLMNFLIAKATADGTTYGLPAVRIPPYQYKMNSPITIPNWIKCAFEGFSIFDFAGAPAGTDHLSISASSLTVPASSFSYNGPCLDGSGGSLLVRGSGLGSSTSAGIFAGNKVAGTSVSREIGLINISVQNCNRALEFGKYGSYLFSATGCRFENNFWNIVTPTGTVSNSGERMVFDKCIIAGSGDGGASIRHQCDTMDLFFTNCSFDFNYDMLLCDVGCTYCAITFDTCHFEGWDNFLVNWRSTSGVNVYINFNTPTILPTTYRLANPLVLNSAARPLVKFGGSKFTRVDVKIHNPVIRLTHAPWVEDPFMSINDNPSDDPAARKTLTVTGYTPYSFNEYGSANTVLNMDFDFQKDAIGTAVSSMSSWMRGVGPSNVSSDMLEDDGSGKKVLALTGTDITNYYFIKSKASYPVRPGQTVYTWTSVSMKGLSMPTGSNPGLPNAQLGVEFVYADGSTARGFSVTKNIGTQFADTGMPNFSDGASRYMATDSLGTLIPQGVVAIRPYIGYTNFVGKLYISRIGSWVQ